MKNLLFFIPAIAAAQKLQQPAAPTEELPPLSSITKRQDAGACEKVAGFWEDQVADSNQSTPIRVPAQLAYECLQSVPVDTDGDLKQIEELKEFINFQSNLNYRKDRIENYDEPLDVISELDEIANNIQDGNYESDYEVQMAMYLLFQKVRDFHFAFMPDLVTALPFFRNGGQIISLSEDGLSLPQVYLVSDLNRTSSDFTASPIEAINGQLVEEYLQEIADISNYHDPDARYNNLFPNLALRSKGSTSGGIFQQANVFDGAITILSFVNGTEKTIDNLATISDAFNYTGVTDGESFFDRFCQGPSNTRDESTSVSPSPTATPAPIGYPSPVFVESSRSFHGYYLNDSGHSDVAVLAIPGFQPIVNGDPYEGLVETQKLLRTFFANAVKDGKDKLLIDLRGNGGGTIDMGFELFKQLFPSIEPFGATRYRAHEAFGLVSAAAAEFLGNESIKEQDPTTYNLIMENAGVFDYRNVLNVNGSRFNSFDEYYGPYTNNNDTFTAIRRYNFSDESGGYTTGGYFNLTGYNSERPAPAQPFNASNIVLLQDGFCGSTCAIFAELMREQGHVHSIAIGGRPKNEPMQAVGGSKGANIFAFEAIYTIMTAAIGIFTYTGGLAAAAEANATAIGRIAATTQLQRRAGINAQLQIPGSANSLDNFRQGDATETPLQFIYEAADCRLFYPKSVLTEGPTSVWRLAADAKWGNGKCVEGSTGHSSSISTVDDQAFNVKEQDPSTGAASGLKAHGLEKLLLGLAVIALLL